MDPGQRARRRIDALRRLRAVESTLGLLEIETLADIGDRIMAGQERYGQFEQADALSKRNWRREALEEHMDALVYLIRELSDQR